MVPRGWMTTVIPWCFISTTTRLTSVFLSEMSQHWIESGTDIHVPHGVNYFVDLLTPISSTLWLKYLMFMTKYLQHYRHPPLPRSNGCWGKKSAWVISRVTKSATGRWVHYNWQLCVSTKAIFFPVTGLDNNTCPGQVTLCSSVWDILPHVLGRFWG